MQTYEPSVRNDLSLYAWYEQLILTKDITALLGDDPARYALSVFFTSFQDPAVLLFESDEKGWWFTMWAKPSYERTAEVGIWIRTDKRHTKSALKAALTGLDLMLQKFSALFAFTTIEAVAEEHEKIGFTRFGVFPPFDEQGHAVYVTYLTRANFAAAHALKATG